MKFTIANRSYQATAPSPEGWVQRGEIFNVGKVHREGLRVIPDRRAKDLVQAGLHSEWREGDAAVPMDPNDPVAIARRVARGEQPGTVLQERTAPARKTKVEPAVKPKAPVQNPTPAAPQPARRGGRSRAPAQPSADTTSQTLPAGGQTGQPLTSASSSPEGLPLSPSTGTRRGMRRGDPAAVKRAGSQLTTPIASSPGQMPSTGQTAPSGVPSTGPKASED